MGSSLDTWVWVPRAHPGNTGREALLPSSGCRLGRARRGLGGYRPALASRGLGSAPRPCGAAGAWLSTRVPQAHAHTQPPSPAHSEPRRGRRRGAPRTPPGSQTEKYYKHSQQRRQNSLL